MRCPKCNFENRPDARFCKKCGQPLQVSSGPPAPSASVCPACGATVKPGARFCPRCGQPMPTTPPAQPQGYAPPPAQPPAPAQPYAQPPAQPPAPAQPYAQPPAQPPAPAQPYAQPPSAPSPPAAQPSQKRKLPRWALWAGIAAAVLLCIIATVMAIRVFKPADKKATATPATVETATVESPAIVTTPAKTPTAEVPTAAPPTVAPAPTFDAQIVAIPFTDTVRIGDPLTITVALTNTGNVSFGKLRYQLLGGRESALELMTDAVVSHDDTTVPPGKMDTATFVFKGSQAGDVTFHVNVTLEVQEEPPRWESLSSDIISVSVTQ